MLLHKKNSFKSFGGSIHLTLSLRVTIEYLWKIISLLFKLTSLASIQTRFISKSVSFKYPMTGGVEI